MTDKLRVVLEIGPKGKRVVAGAYEWPGLERWGRNEDDALAKLASYQPRYAGVAARAGLADEFAAATGLEVVERYAGNTSTDFWGIAHVPSATEQPVLARDELDRRMALMRATWDYFNETASRVSAELRLGPRGGGRSRDQIFTHVYASERHNWWRKVGIRQDDEARLTPEELAFHRARYLDAIYAYNAQGKPARSWPIQFLIRRTAQHAMDHAWEMEDRDLG
jgi:hypothetical protein